MQKNNEAIFICPVGEHLTKEELKAQANTQGISFDVEADTVVTTLIDAVYDSLSQIAKSQGLVKTNSWGVVSVPVNGVLYYPEEAERYGKNNPDSIGHTLSKLTFNTGIAIVGGVVGSFVGVGTGIALGAGAGLAADSFKITNDKKLYDILIRDKIEKAGGFSKFFAPKETKTFSYEEVVNLKAKYVPNPDLLTDKTQIPTSYLSNDKISIDNVSNVAKSTTIIDPTVHFQPDYIKEAFNNSHYNVKESVIPQPESVVVKNDVCNVQKNVDMTVATAVHAISIPTFPTSCHPSPLIQCSPHSSSYTSIDSHVGGKCYGDFSNFSWLH
ncbi:MAG: hypothetical protein J0H68_01360 [Sphingobacteriia bacterium]|nr:hypothetical protein [Sphingobacteriia bacterium]